MGTPPNPWQGLVPAPFLRQPLHRAPTGTPSDSRREAPRTSLRQALRLPIDPGYLGLSQIAQRCLDQFIERRVDVHPIEDVADVSPRGHGVGHLLYELWGKGADDVEAEYLLGILVQYSLGESFFLIPASPLG